jgi:hypothetical protein
MSRTISQDLRGVLAANPDIIVLCTGHKLYSKDSTIDLVNSSNSLFVFDTIGLLTEFQIQKLIAHHVVKVLGRGDI